MSLVIGLAGGSGSGKTTVVRRIVESLGGEHVTVLDHDRYYRDHPELRLEERAALNYDHPDALETGLMVRHVELLKAGRAIDAPVYDFTRHGRAAATERFEPRTALIVEGILVFADKRLRDLMDIRSSWTPMMTSGSSGGSSATRPIAGAPCSRWSISTSAP